MATRERNLSLDIMKFLAVFLITNSHMDKLYGDYSAFATGGAIGDVLFFFCSGYTMFLGQLGRFDTWYKKRIRRIFPSVIALNIIGAFVWGFERDLKYVITYGGEWFVSCIMIYYVILYFIRRYAVDKLKWMFLLTGIVTLIWFFLYYRDMTYSIYKWTHIKWCFYFFSMLLGATVGLKESQIGYRINSVKDKWDKTWINIFLMFVCVGLYYGIMYIWKKNPSHPSIQIWSVAPLIGVNWYFYKLCCGEWVKKIFAHKKCAWVISAIGGLCLEIYLVQPYLFTTKMNHLFPLNLLIMFAIIVPVAYLCRALGRWFQQTFSIEEGYNWKEVFKIV